MEKTTNPVQEWSTDFGRQYTDRNPSTIEELDELYIRYFGKKRSLYNEEFLGKLPRDLRILEVGCNMGAQLNGLQKMGFKNLYGIELQSYAVERAKERNNSINIIQGSAFDLPFKDGFFDLVYTSGVLIHIHPDKMKQTLSEVYRCSKKYIWGYEYYSKEYTSIPYRGQDDLLWKADFAKLYLDQFTDLELIKEVPMPYLGSTNQDTMYLIQKRGV